MKGLTNNNWENRSAVHTDHHFIESYISLKALLKIMAWMLSVNPPSLLFVG